MRLRPRLHRQPRRRFEIKTNPDSTPTDDPTATRKTLITIADAQGNSGSIIDTYSGCAHAASENVLTQLKQELSGDGPNGETHIVAIDVSGAYGKAKGALKHLRRDLTTGAVSGRALYARMPAWLAKYGIFPTHDAHGRPNPILIHFAMPGRRESDRWWEIVHHRFLRQWGFIQGVWDTPHHPHWRTPHHHHPRRRHPRPVHPQVA